MMGANATYRRRARTTREVTLADWTSPAGCFSGVKKMDQASNHFLKCNANGKLNCKFQTFRKSNRINASQEQNSKDTSNHIGGVERITEAFIMPGALINYRIPHLR